MKMFVGTYTGTGSSNPITGVGFQPDLVIIKGSGQRLIFRSASFAGDATATLGGALSNFTGGITSLDSDGFTLGTNTMSNNSGTTFYYATFKDDDNTFAYGTYTGNGSSQSITGLGFQPNYVVVKQGSNTQRGRWTTTSMGTNKTMPTENSATESGSITSLDSDGFSVGSNAQVNANTASYFWFAFKTTSNQFAEGTYTGTGVDLLDITTVGFQSDMIMIGGDAAVEKALRFSSNSGDSSFGGFGTNATAADIIQSILSNGFDIGTSNTVNTLATNYYWACIKIPVSGGAATYRRLGLLGVGN